MGGAREGGSGRAQALVEWLGRLEEVAVFPVGLCKTGRSEPQFLHYSSVSSVEKLTCTKMNLFLSGVMALTLQCLNFTSLKQEHGICIPFFPIPAFICA